MKYKNLLSGVKLIFIAQIIQIVAAVLALVAATSFLFVKGEENTGIVLLAMTFLFLGGFSTLVAFILTFIGLIQGSRDETRFHKGLVMAIISISLTIISTILGFFTEIPYITIITGVIDALCSVIEIMVITQIVLGIRDVADRQDEIEIVRKGRHIETIIYVLFIIAIITNVVPVFFLNPPQWAAILLSVISFVGTIIQIIVYIIFILYLHQAKKMLAKYK